MTEMTHEELVRRAERWLKQQGCGVVIRDELSVATHNGEWPDALGWRDGLSILVECKVSRADFLADRKKSFRQAPEKGMGDWRFYLCPPGLIAPEEIPAGWGLLYAHGRRIEKVCGAPKGNCGWWHDKPFEGAKRYETQILLTALRRLSAHADFERIYDSPKRASSATTPAAEKRTRVGRSTRKA